MEQKYIYILIIMLSDSFTNRQHTLWTQLSQLRHQSELENISEYTLQQLMILCKL